MHSTDPNDRRIGQNAPKAAALLVALAIALPVVAGARAREQAPAQSAAPATGSAKSWLGHAAEIEAYMKSATVVRVEDTPRGVTKSKRAFLEPGGPVESFTWKPLASGRTGGFRESYRAEIAAYELDKLLQLDLVPPKVERTFEGETGAAIMWVAPTRSFAGLGGPPTPPPEKRGTWNRQLMQAKIFHNLIGDIDPNLGNWLVDPEWNLILVDHSRALTTTTKLVHKLQQVDSQLWERITALDQAALTDALGTWLTAQEIQAILDRRAAMQKEIDKLVRSKGRPAVFVP